MANIAEVIALWKALDVEAIARESIRDNEAAIVNQQAEQMRLGKNSKGEKIGWYTNSYAAIKTERADYIARPKGVVDLHDTGAFYGGLKANLSGDQLELTSTDPKTPMLVGKYGEEIFGLEPNSLEALQEDVFVPDMTKRIKEAVKL